MPVSDYRPKHPCRRCHRNHCAARGDLCGPCCKALGLTLERVKPPPGDSEEPPGVLPRHAGNGQAAPERGSSPVCDKADAARQTAGLSAAAPPAPITGAVGEARPRARSVSGPIQVYGRGGAFQQYEARDDSPTLASPLDRMRPDRSEDAPRPDMPKPRGWTGMCRPGDAHADAKFKRGDHVTIEGHHRYSGRAGVVERTPRQAREVSVILEGYNREVYVPADCLRLAEATEAQRAQGAA